MIEARIGIFFRSVWHGILGIAAELMLISFFIAAAFIVCTIWWGINR